MYPRHDLLRVRNWQADQNVPPRSAHLALHMVSVMRSFTVVLVVILLFGAAMPAATLQAKAPRVLPEGKRPNDMRLKPLKDLNGYFPFQPASSPQQWQRRAAEVRRRMLVSLGLWPLPTKSPLRPVIHGKIERTDYTVEKVYFESMPGFFVTGNLYRPKGKSRCPGILCPHGHWNEGRFYDAGVEKAKELLDKGGEHFAEAARSHLQARCVHLARMGCVVFHYDMIGYADSQQIHIEVAHRFDVQRPEMNSAKNWGLFSPQAESHLQNVMGLQSWSTIRALDFLETLPEVDRERLAVTGASGGGTQTFVVSALDSRVAVSMPCVMVSTAMQGGCTCENCSLLRIGTGNVEFAALFAPKPLGLTAADDWTKEIAKKGFPELQQHFKLLGKPENVMLVNRTEFKHNYNAVSRAAMYRWFNKHLRLKLTEDQLKERKFQRLTRQQMSVWNDGHARPAGGPKLERDLLGWWHADTGQQLKQLIPSDARTLRKYRQVVASAADIIIGKRLPEAKTVEYEQVHKTDRGDFLSLAGLLKHAPEAAEQAADAESPHVELPIAFLYPKQWEGTAVIWIDEQGKSGLFEKDGSPIKPVKRLLNAGMSVVGVDLFQQGEFRPDSKPLKKTRRVASTERQFAGYTLGYNHSVFAKRVHDILTVTTFVRNHAYQPERVLLVGIVGDTGALVAAARAQAGSAIDRAAINTEGFRFGKQADLRSPNFLPGGAKYFDLPGMLSLSAPDQLWVGGETEESLKLVRAAYQAAGATDKLKQYSGSAKDLPAAALKWLLAE